jgi:integrase/DNA-binding XRE family transcriptional regulator
MPNLTKRYIDSLAVTQTRAIHWDSGLKGFGLLLLPSGVRSFIYNYRSADGRKRRYTIGRFGALTVEQARARARELAGRVARGEDPAAAAKSRRDAPTVSDLLDDYLAKHVRVENAPKTLESAQSAVKLHIRPALGALKVAAVTRQDVQRMHGQMKDSPRAANLALAALSKAMTLAEDWEWRPRGSNPCRGVKRYPEKRRSRFLSGDELVRLGHAMQEAETIGLPWRERDGAKAKHRPKEENRRTLVSPRALAAIRLLLFTGARLSEIRELRWRDVDLERGTIALPGRKGGERLAHPISSMARQILEALPRVKLLSGKPSPWVLPAPKNPSKPLTRSVVSNAWQALRARAGIPDVRLHDERHTAGTFAGQTNANAFLIRDLLRHKTTATTNIYVNADEDPMRATFEAIGRRIEAGLGGASAEMQRLAATANSATDEAADIAAYAAAREQFERDGARAIPPEISALVLAGRSRLTAVRLWRGLTQSELADKAGVAATEIGEIERKRRICSRQTAARLAAALDVAPEWIA